MKRVRFSLVITDREMEMVQNVARSEGVTVTAVIRRMIRELGDGEDGLVRRMSRLEGKVDVLESRWTP